MAVPLFLKGRKIRVGRVLYYGARYYDPVVGIWHGVDPLAEMFPDMSPYNFVANNPIKFIDMKGDSVSPIARSIVGDDNQGLIRTATTDLRENNPVRAAVADATIFALSAKGINALDNLIFGSDPVEQRVLNAGMEIISTVTPTKMPKIKGPLKVDNTFDRVKVRKGTKDKVTENQPKNDKGELLDPNDFTVLDPKKTDLAHKPGHEFNRYKNDPANKNKTRKEVIEDQNNPEIYQCENMTNNRGRKFEKKN